MELEEIVKERIKENEKLFSKEELKTIKNNIILTKKVYMIGLVNGKQIYGK